MPVTHRTRSKISATADPHHAAESQAGGWEWHMFPFIETETWARFNEIQ